MSTHEPAAYGSLPEPTSIRSYVSKDEMAYETLREWIVGGAVLPPGTPIDHTKYAEILGLSRTPVRNAISRLISEGHMVGEPHKTPRVAPLDVDEYQDVRAARAVIEPMLISYATPKRTDADVEMLRRIYSEQTKAIEAEDTAGYVRLDREFHRGLYAPSELRRSLGIFEQLRDVSDRYTNIYVMDRARSRLSLQEHLEILEHFAAGDATNAERALKKHLTQHSWVQFLKSTQGDQELER